MDLIRKNELIFDRVAKYFDKWPFSVINKKIQEKMAENMKIVRGRVLDAGCGSGTLLNILKRRNLDIFGVDVSRKMIEKARKKVGREAILIKDSIEEVKLDKKFDYIVSVDTFHHLPDKSRALKNLATHLKKRGHLAILDISLGVFNWLFYLIEPGNSGMCSPKDFKRLFATEGLKVVEQKRVYLLFVLTVGKK